MSSDRREAVITLPGAASSRHQNEHSCQKAERTMALRAAGCARCVYDHSVCYVAMASWFRQLRFCCHTPCGVFRGEKVVLRGVRGFPTRRVQVRICRSWSTRAV